MSLSSPSLPAVRRDPVPPLIALLLGFLLFAPGGLGAQEDGPEVFTDRVEVNVVEVEVYVTDDQGRPVTGLGPEDFEMRVDGEPVPIANFYAVEDPVGGLRGRLAAPREAGEGETTPRDRRVIPPPPAPERRMHLVVYIDEQHLTPNNRNRVLEGLELFLEERLVEGDLVMVVGTYPRFDVLVPFTDDRQAVLAAVAEARERAPRARALERQMLVRRMVNSRGDPGSPALANSMLSSVREYAREESEVLRRQLQTLEAFVGSLAGLPGRKAVLHLSEGLPVRPGEDLFQAWSSVFGVSVEGGGSSFSLSSDGSDPAASFSGVHQEAARFDMTHEVQQVVEEANAAGVTFFTLDVGDETLASVNAATPGTITQDLTRVDGPEVTANVQLTNEQSLLQMAGDTGGVPVLNANNPWKVMEQVAATFDNFYSLGYVQEGSDPGEYHNIEVKVRRPGLKVRHRTGYKELTNSERLENHTVAALLLERWDNPLQVFLEVGEGERKKRKRWQLPLQVKIPLDQLTLLPGPGEHRGLVTVRVAFQDPEEAGFGISREMQVPIRVPDDRIEESRDQHYTVEVSLELGSGWHRLTVGVLDLVGAEASFVPYDVVMGEG